MLKRSRSRVATKRFRPVSWRNLGIRVAGLNLRLTLVYLAFAEARLSTLRNYFPIVYSPQNAHAFDNYAPTWMRRALRFFFLFFKYSLRLRASILLHSTRGEARDDATAIMIVGLGEVEIDERFEM